MDDEILALHEAILMARRRGHVPSRSPFHFEILSQLFGWQGGYRECKPDRPHWAVGLSRCTQTPETIPRFPEGTLPDLVA
jgi:hypothetical protein